MTFHTQVVGANGQRQAMFIERVEGLAEAILANFELGAARRDARLQRTAARPRCRSRWRSARGAAGCPVIAVTSRRAVAAGEPSTRPGRGCSTTPTSCSTSRTPAGDALVAIDGVDTPVAPGLVARGRRARERDEGADGAAARRAGRAAAGADERGASSGREASAAALRRGVRRARAAARAGARAATGLTEQHARDSVSPDVRNV